MNISDQIFSRAMKEGFTKEAGCALLANIQAESAFVPNNLEDGYEGHVGMTDQQYTEAVDSGRYTNFIYDRCGYGLCQWTYWSRKKMLLKYAINNNASIGSFEMQREFIFYEMRQSFPVIWTACRTSHDLEYLVHELLYKWENPDEKENNMKRRLASAQGFYQKYAVWESSKEETKMTKDQAIQKVLSIAKAEIGYHETGDNWTKYAQEMDRTNWYNGGKNGFAWCDVFVDWLFYKAFGDPLGREMICQPAGSAGAGCLYSAQYYKGAGRWNTTDPQPGDQIFFTYSPGEYSHTGIVETVQSGIVTTIEGNTSDQVARRQYTVGSSNIAGYGRPKWELATGAEPSPDHTPQPSPSPSGFGRILKKGMRGDDVKKMQEMLTQLGYGQLLQPDGADGDFGNNTYNAVVQFQMKNGLYVDGEAGPDTLGKMQELVKGNSAPKEDTSKPSVIKDEDQPRQTGITMIRNGDKGNLVKLAQAALYHLGYELSIDGIFGDTFEKKIKQFQEKNGLEVDGIIGKDTWQKLLEIPYRGTGATR